MKYKYPTRSNLGTYHTVNDRANVVIMCRLSLRRALVNRPTPGQMGYGEPVNFRLLKSRKAKRQWVNRLAC